MRIRRIFRPAPTDPRRWGKFAVGLGTVAGAALMATALPGDLFGSAQPEPSWIAAAAEVRVLDGDTLRLGGPLGGPVGGRLLRLDGVAVPERGHATCPARQDPTRDCAGAAAEALVRLVADSLLECQVQRRDGQARALGICRARPAGQTTAGDGVELNAALVAAGWAMAQADALPALAALEAGARRDRRGLWAADANLPESWRRRF